MSKPVALAESVASVIRTEASDVGTTPAVSQQTGKTAGRIVTILNDMSPESKRVFIFIIYSLAIIALGALIASDAAGGIPSPHDIIRRTAGLYLVAAGVGGLVFAAHEKARQVWDSLFKNLDEEIFDKDTLPTFEPEYIEEPLRVTTSPEEPLTVTEENTDNYFKILDIDLRIGTLLPEYRRFNAGSYDRTFSYSATKPVTIAKVQGPRSKAPARPATAVAASAPSATTALPPKTITPVLPPKGKANVGSKPRTQIRPESYYFARRGVTSFWG